MESSGTGQQIGRVLALDLGKRRIGLAISDALGITAQGLPTVQRTRLREDLQRLTDLAREKEVGLFLLGLPLHLSGNEGRQAGWVREFGDKLTEFSGLPVEYWDERFTSVVANRVLRESGMGIEKRAQAVDRLAAVILLESFLSRPGEEDWQ
jgi:putative Holliday junction resolvase